MAAHIDEIALKQKAGVRGMQRIDLRMLRAVQKIDVVSLNGLI
jgi:hypothetical protein